MPNQKEDNSHKSNPSSSSSTTEVTTSSILEDDIGLKEDDFDDDELVFRKRSRPSTAHASIQMEHDEDGNTVDNGSVIMKFSSRPQTSAVFDGSVLNTRSLHQIARDGDLKTLKETVAKIPTHQLELIVNESEDLNEQKTPLHYAARYWHYDFIVELLNLGAYINAGDYCDYTALHYACRFKRNGDLPASEHSTMPQPLSAKTVDILESINSPWRQEENNKKADETVEQVKKRLMVERVILGDEKATINLPQDLLGKMPVFHEKQNFSDVKQENAALLAEDEDLPEKVNLEEETTSNRRSVIELLLENGADMNAHDSYGVTPLHVCCMRGNLESAQELLQYDGIEVSAEDKQGLRAIHNACIYGYPDLVELLIEHGADLRAKDMRRQTPLHRAALAGYPKIVKLLLDAAETTHGPEYKLQMLQDLDADNNSPLHLGTTKGSPEVCEILIQHGADREVVKKSSGATALHSAAKAGNVELCQVLLKGGSKINATNKMQQTPLHLAAYFDKTDCVKLLLKRSATKDARDANNFTPLLLAASTGSPETIKALLDAGSAVDVVDKEERSALYWAARKGNVKVVDLLLGNSVGVKIIDKGDKEGNTPMHTATEKGHLEVVKLLLKHGARIDAKNDDEDSPLTNAAYGGHGKVIEVLLKADPRMVNDVEEHSLTPLHLACMTDDADDAVVTMLVEAGADVDAKDLDFISVLDYAATNGHVQSIKTLLKKGAQLNVADRFGVTPLMRSTYSDQVEALKELLKRGADVAMIDRNGCNALDNAILKDANNCTEALVQNKNWEKSLDNWYLDTTTGFRITPLRSLIESMPEVAIMAFDKCVKHSTYSDENGKDLYKVCYDYKYLDDVDWAQASLKAKKKRTTCCKCCCLDCGTKFCKLGHWRYSCCKGCTKDGADEEEIKPTFLVGGVSEDGKDPLEIVRMQGVEEVFNLEKNHPLSIMVKHGRTELLSHPLTLALINYKWRKFGRVVYYANLALYSIFLAFLTGYALTGSAPVPAIKNAETGEFQFQGSCQVSGSSRAGSSTLRKTATAVEVFRDIAKPAIFALAGLNAARELFQLIHRNFLVYFNAENGLELACYSTALLFVLDFTECSQETGVREPWQWQIGAVAVFLAWLNLLLFIRKVPFFGIYVVMVMDVFRTFCKFLPVFLFFIIGFAMAFHVLLQQQTPFRSSTESFIKTFVMMVGELDFEGMFYDSPNRPLLYPGLTHCLFILFLLIVSIILMNLLVGLAVDDIKAVQERATLERLAMQVRMVVEVENILPNWLRKKFITGIETLTDPNPPSNPTPSTTDSDEQNVSDSKSGPKEPKSESASGVSIVSQQQIERRLKLMEKNSSEKISALMQEEKKTQDKTMKLQLQMEELMAQTLAMTKILTDLASASSKK